IALITILHVARSRDAMKFVRIDHELSFDSQTTQRLVHLLTTLHRNVEAALAAEEKSRRLDAIGMQERIGDLNVSLPRFRIPRRTDLVVVLNDVLVGAVERDRERRTRAAGCAFE